MKRFIDTASDNTIIVLISIIILSFIKGLFSLFERVNRTAQFISDKSIIHNVDEILDTIINTITFVFAFYILFFRKDNSILIIILGIMFLLKGFLQYFIDLQIYKYTNIDNSTIDKIRNYKYVNGVVTDTILTVIAVYMIIKIF